MAKALAVLLLAIALVNATLGLLIVSLDNAARASAWGGLDIRCEDRTSSARLFVQERRGDVGLCDGLGQRRKLLVEMLRIHRQPLLDRVLCPDNGLGELVGQRGLAHDDECRRP